MSGVEVWSNRSDVDPEFSASPYVADVQEGAQSTHVAFTKPVAAALVALADLAPDIVTQLWQDDVDHVIAKRFETALDALDAARAQECHTSPATGAAEETRHNATIHPPVHYQIDTSTPGWNTRYVDAVAKEHGWTRAEAQGRIADGGAG